MICFSLICGQEHGFDSWFAKSSDFDTLLAGGHVACPTCGDKSIRKALMAPAIAVGQFGKTQPEPPVISDGHAGAMQGASTQPSPLSTPSNEAQRAMEKLRAHLEANSDYVGMNFAAEARAIHLGDAPVRAIYGEAKPDEARALLEDGIPVAPLPFLPRVKTN